MEPIRRKDEKEMPKPAMPQPQQSERPMQDQNASKRTFTDSEDSVIISKRPRLIEKGLADGTIAKKLVKELPGRTVASIDSRLRRLVLENNLKENPNNRDRLVFTAEEDAIIQSERPKLIEKGLVDYGIAKVLIQKLPGRTAGSIDAQIRQLISENKLNENPNKHEIAEFTIEDDAIIQSERPKLIEKGLTDGGISKELTTKFPGRSAGAIDSHIRRLVSKKKLNDNPNKQANVVFTIEENAIIQSERPKLIEKGLTDGEISKELTRNLPGRTVASINNQIRRLLSKKKLDENSNKKETVEFTIEDDAIIQSERSKLIEKGLTDGGISKELTKNLLGRTASSIIQRISVLIDSKRLKENPHKQTSFSEEDNAKLISRRQKLIDNEHLNDGEVSRQLAPELKRTIHSIKSQIKRLIESNKLDENPYRQEHKEFSDEDNAKIKCGRQELIDKEHLTDFGISMRLALVIERSPGTIDSYIRNLIKVKQLKENPYKRHYKRIPGGAEDAKAQIEALLRKYTEQEGPATAGL